MEEAFLQTMGRMRTLNFFPPASLTKGEFSLLTWLHRQGVGQEEGLRVSQLAQRLQVSTPAVSRMLRTLERRGLVERMADQADRRSTYIVLTQRGETLYRQCARQLQGCFGRVLDQMGARQMEEFLHLWNRLIDIMAQTLPDQCPPAGPDGM